MTHVEPTQNSINIVKSHFEEIHRNLKLAAEYCEDDELRTGLEGAYEAFAEFTISFNELTTQTDTPLSGEEDTE